MVALNIINVVMFICFRILFRSFFYFDGLYFIIQSGSLYNEGMRPLLYSEKDAQEKNIGWMRAGNHIKYYKNDIK